MALVADIRTALSGVGAAFADAGPFEYRFLTVAPNNKVARTYTAWTAFSPARVTEEETVPTYDDNTGAWYLEFRCVLHIPAQASVPDLSRSDEIRIGGSSGRIWAIDRMINSGIGAVQRYSLMYREVTVGNSRTGAN